MALDAGTRLGPYSIIGLLGAGGMGEVYRARDTKLGRDVAIKTLPAAFAADKHRLTLFEREAQLLAALNHPHIASIYSLAEHEGSLYLAMELLEGTTLADVIARGAMPVDEALRVALQIAGALEAAHGKGVMHRDLKPANVMLAHDGQVKVLDFGLAKAFGREPIDASPAHSPASLAMTQQGLVLGTAGYMSPEQASGQASDQRADVWAFGVVLYEMLTGATLFEGESVTHILAGVLKSEPDWTRLPTTLDPRLRILLERCLTKKPRNRLHSIADARIEIDSVLADPAGAKSADRGRRSASPAIFGGAIAATAVVAAVAAWFARPVPSPGPVPVVRLSMPLPDNHPTHPSPMIAISRDGTRIAYLANDQTLNVRDLSKSQARPVPGTSEPFATTEPTFSPDGQSLAYVRVIRGGGPYVINRIPVEGGTPVAVYEAPTTMEYPRGLSWPEPDALLFANHQGVVRLPANGGTPEVLVPRGEGEFLFSPQLLPDAEFVLFTRVSGTGERLPYDQGEIVIASIRGADRQVVWQGGSAARYLPSGHLLFVQRDALFAIAFDVDARAVRGGPLPLLQGLRRPTGPSVSDAANYAVSDTGTLAMLPAAAGAASPVQRVRTTLTWVDRSGREEPLAAVRPDYYTTVRISPDGTKIALVIGARGSSTQLPAIWIYDLRTENLSLLATEPAINDSPVWSADSRHVYFRALRLNEQGAVAGGDVYSIEIETGEVTLLAESTPDFPITIPWAVVPGGETLALVNALNAQKASLATLSLSSRQFARLLEEEGSQSDPSFSRDGAWIAYSDVRSGGVIEVNLRPFPGVTRTRTPVGNGGHPVFSRDGAELFFRDEQSMVVAAVSHEPMLRIGPPRRLFTASYEWGEFGRAWDLDPTGQRFLMIRSPSVPEPARDDALVDESERPRIDVVVNWVKELEARVPSGTR